MIATANKAHMPSGAVIEFWDAAAVEARLIDCAETIKRVRMRGVWPAMYGSSWPDIIQEFWDAFGWHDVEIAPAPPTAAAITRMDETMIWFLYIKQPRDRRIAWAKAFGVSDGKIARIIGQSRWTVRRRYKAALEAIIRVINDGPVPRQK